MKTLHGKYQIHGNRKWMLVFDTNSLSENDFCGDNCNENLNTFIIKCIKGYKLIFFSTKHTFSPFNCNIY